MFKQALILLTAAGALAAGPCLAHAKLIGSMPANQAQLSAPPKTLTLNFNEAAQLAVLKLISDGKEIPVPLDNSAKPGQIVTVALPALVPGNYTVQWTAMAADDGHVTKGSFTFSVSG